MFAGLMLTIVLAVDIFLGWKVWLLTQRKCETPFQSAVKWILGAWLFGLLAVVSGLVLYRMWGG